MEAPHGHLSLLPKEVLLEIINFAGKMSTGRCLDKRIYNLCNDWFKMMTKTLCLENPSLNRFASGESDVVRFKRVIWGLKRDGEVLECSLNGLTRSLDEASQTCIRYNRILLERKARESHVSYCLFLREVSYELPFLRDIPPTPSPEDNPEPYFTKAKKAFDNLAGNGDLSSVQFLSLEKNLIIPDAINRLSALRRLEVKSNKYVQTFPVLELPSLETLILSQLPHLEEVPSISFCTRLTSLRMTELPLIKHIPSCSSLSGLLELRLELPKLQNLPDSFIYSPALQEVHFTGMPVVQCWPTISQMTQLRNLSIRVCPLKELPDTVSCLVNLETLVINNAKLESLPNGIGFLSKLVTLDLSKRNLISCLPDSFSGLTSLQKLKLSENALTHFPDIRGLSSLSTLVVKDNHITRVPDYLAGLTQLTRVDVRDNLIREEDIPEALKSHPVFKFY